MTDTMDALFVKSHVPRDLLQNAVVFKTDKLVVWEYVSNGLQYVDPGTNPRVKVTLDSKRKEIVIEDNGRGMDWAGLNNFFVMHGENIDLKQGRPGRGRFGTGKSAAFGIGDELTITTIRSGRRSTVTLRRDEIEAVTETDRVPVRALEREVPVEAANGTTVRIGGIRLKGLDQPGVIRYIERHLARWPKNASVVVNNHECEYEEPPVSRVVNFTPDGPLAGKLGDVDLIIKVSKTPLDEDLRGVSIYANGVWHETTLAGNDGRDMAQYIFGDLDVPALDEDRSATPPFDLTRSMRLNAENDLVQAIYAFVGKSVDDVRRQLVEEERARKQGEDAKRLARQAEKIADLINEDFNEFRQKLAKVKAKASGGSDLHDLQHGGLDAGDELLAGIDVPAVETEVGNPGHGDGHAAAGDGPPPNMAPSLLADPAGPTTGSPRGGSEGRRKPRGGFSVRFHNMGADSSRARYFRDERAIYINLDHPQLVAAKGLGSTDETAFRRLAYEVAFAEYSIALAVEMAAQGHFMDPSDAIVEIGETLNRLARKGASLYEQ